MPRIQEIGPASTPSLFLENQYQLSQQQISQQYKNLQQQYRRQQIDYETAAKEIADMQAESDAQTEAFQSNMRMMQQSQKFVDLGIISAEESQEAMWAQVLPRELHEKMYPKEAADPQRVPFAPAKMAAYQDTIEEFATSAVGKKYGWFGIDRLAKDKPATQKLLLEKYNSWKTNIGYDAMTFSQQKQVDNEWDAWIADKEMKWNPESKEVLAARGKGPLTRGYGSRFRGTPMGPREAADPLQGSIALELSKRRKPEPKKKQKTAEELRKENTSEAYKLGRQLGYWN